MKISCCMIIRDEAANLERLFASVRPHVDEICVLDTGSTDDSPLICQKYADKWEQWLGCNGPDGRITDFSAARNRNLQQATHEALLWLDGDDELVGGVHLRKLVSEAPRGSAWQYLAEYEYDQDAEGRPTTVQWRERLVYPREGFEWRGPVHEGLLGKAGTSPVMLGTEELRVVHRRRKLGKATDPERNLRILKDFFSKNGEADDRLMHYFGSELLINRQIGEAMYWFRRHVQRAPWSDERCLSLLQLARIHLAIGDYGEAARWALEATATKTWPDPWWLLGSAYMSLSEQGVSADYNLRRGLNALEQGFRLDVGDAHKRTLLMTDPQARYDALGWFAPALAKAGRLDDAIEAAERGLAGKPELAHLQQNLLEWRKAKVMQAAEKLAEVGGLDQYGLTVVGAALKGDYRVEPTRPKLEALPTGKLRIAFWLGHQLEPWTPDTLEANGMGGSETMAWELSKRLAKKGHYVSVYGHTHFKRRASTALGYEVFEGVHWYDASYFEQLCEYDVLIVSRQFQAVHMPHQATAHVLWVHDVHVGETFTPRDAAKFDFIWCLSEWHKSFFLSCYPWLSASKVEVTRNGIDVARFARTDVARHPHRAIYSSSPDRGLAEAVEAWPAVRAAVPDAELHCYYGFDNWDRALELGMNVDHPHCGKAARDKLKAAIAATEGVVMHGRVNQRELAEAMLGAGVWFYPTWFSETSCITAMEAQAAGLICVTTREAALIETNWTATDSGFWVLSDAVRPVVKAMKHAEHGPMESASKSAMKSFSLDTLADLWEDRLNKLVADRRASVVMPFVEAAQ